MDQAKIDKIIKLLKREIIKPQEAYDLLLVEMVSPIDAENMVQNVLQETNVS